MAIIKFKRRSSGGAAGAPASLKTTEPAYSEVDDILYLGFGDDGGGNATSIKQVGGKGAFVDKSTDQTILGIKTFSASPIAPTVSSADNSTKVATTAFVKSLNYVTGNQTITLSGDATGSGTTAITVTLSPSGVTAGTYPKVTVDTKGRVTAGSALADTDIPTLTASKISNFMTTVYTARLDQLAAPTASVSMNNQKLINVADPVADTDAANKRYVDSARAGLDAKDSCRVATTANITLSAPQTIDGISVIAGDRVLVKDQTATQDNGIYVVQAAAWTRATDADESAEVTSGMFTFIEEGTANADTGWVLSTNGTITVGTTGLSFVKFSSAAAINAGDGLVQSGQDFNVVGTANRLTVFANNIDIASNYVGQTSITTVGTITTGTWQGVSVKANYGGTGLTGYTAGDMIYATGATTLAKVAIGASGQFLQSNGSAPVWTDTIDGGTF